MNILVRPIITEKATHLSENKNQYTFLVNGEANKIQIKSAVEVNYGVKVKKVSTIICGSSSASILLYSSAGAGSNSSDVNSI